MVMNWVVRWADSTVELMVEVSAAELAVRSVAC